MINRLFAQRYQVTEKIGTGGMAEVYKATDEVLGRTVAIKTMLPQYAADPTFAARFRQEAQAAANLSSPYIVNIYDWGRDGDTYFIVMEYIRGIDLKSAIKQRGMINERKAAEIGMQICSALSVAHDYDIIHRDIKPQNIMIQPDGNAKVMDFGIARAGNSNLTQTNSVLGTAHYVSPEQARGHQLGAQSDLYSLGIVLYECVTGHLPFDGPDAVSVTMKQVTEQPLPPSDLNPNLDPTLEAVILHALEKDPDDRFASAADMRDALSNWLAGRPVVLTSSNPEQDDIVMHPGAAVTEYIPNTPKTQVMPTPVVNEAEQARQMTSLYDNDEATEKEKRKRPRTAIIIGIAIILLAGVITGLALNIFGGGGTATVPDVVNSTRSKATTTIQSAGFEVGDITEVSSDTVTAGLVISQSPEGGSTAAKGSKIDLTISSGPENQEVAIPNIVGMTESEAQAALADAGLKYRAGTAEYSDTVPEGQVISQSPEAQSEVKQGTEVVYILSKGAQSTSVPDVTGMSYSEAITTLNNAGFEVDIPVDHEYSDTVGKGLVIRYSPTSGVPNKDTVTIVVSDGPDTASQQTDVPDVTGLDEESAISTISSAGFTIKEVTYNYSDTIPVGSVISYSPGKGIPGTDGVRIVISLGPASSGSDTEADEDTSGNSSSGS